MLRTLIVIIALQFLGACAPESSSVQPQASQSSQSESSTTECSLKMGWDPWEPYHYRDVGGEVHGLDIELISAIANAAGCTVDYDQENWATLLTRLRDGEIDILSGATRTAAREAFAWFSEPYRDENFGLYVRDGEGANFAGESLRELLENGLTVGTTLEYVYGSEVEALQDDPRFASNFAGAAIGELNVDRLLNFKIDSFLEDPFVAATIIRRRGLEEKIEAHHVVLETGSVHFMFSRNSMDAEIVRRLNEGLSNIRASGEYQRIIDRYL